MSRAAESHSPERTSGTEKVSDFIHITDELRREDPNLFEDVTAVLHLSAELERSGLSEDRQHYLEDERRLLVEELMERPEESILAEIDILARSYRDRSISGVDYDGVTTTQFVTRDPERMKADLHFQISDYASGKSVVRVEVPLRGEMYETAEPFFISIDTEQGLTIEQQHYARGLNRRMRIDPASELGKDRLWRFFTHSIMATDLLDNRPKEEQAQANARARQMLRDKILHG